VAPVTISIAVASSVKQPLETLIAEYQRDHPHVRIESTSGASGTLTAQIVNGAPFDLFFSADTRYPRELVERKLTRDRERLYATGTLVLWTRGDSRVDLATRGIGAVSHEDVRHIAIANPETAPYGRAARAALERHGLTAAAAPKLVTGENVEQTAQFAQSGAAEVAFIPLSLALSPALKDVGTYILVPADAYPPIEHAVVITNRAPDEAAAFIAFVAGPRGREVLGESGFGPASE
jgi:molybdate transport system substrate-binding protein